MGSYTRQQVIKRIAGLFWSEAQPEPDPEPIPTMTVRVIDRGTGRAYIGLTIVTVTVPAICPTCGAPRGKPYYWRFCEDGEWYSCDRWDNECGHVDMYSAVLAEYRLAQLAEAGHG